MIKETTEEPAQCFGREANLKLEAQTVEMTSVKTSDHRPYEERPIVIKGRSPQRQDEDWPS